MLAFIHSLLNVLDLTSPPFAVFGRGLQEVAVRCCSKDRGFVVETVLARSSVSFNDRVLLHVSGSTV